MAIFLKLDGVTGNATSSQYKGWLNVNSYSWGFNIPVSTSGGSGSNRQSPGKVSMGELHLTKEQDSSTATLMQKAFAGTAIKTGNLVVTRNINKSEVEMARYDMENVLLSNYQTGGGDGGDNPTESLSLNFSKMTISQTSTDATGSSPKAVRAGWDIDSQVAS